MDATNQIVEESFTQGAVGHTHLLDPHGLEHRRQDRQPAREHRRAFRGQAFDVQLVDMAGIDHRLHQLFQAGGTDPILAPARFVDRINTFALELLRAQLHAADGRLDSFLIYDSAIARLCQSVPGCRC